MRSSNVVKIIVAVLIVAILGAGVVFGLYSAGVISFGSSSVDEDGNKIYKISYELTGAAASEDNVTTITENGTATLIFTKTYSNYDLQEVDVDGATLRYYREDGSTITVVISNPESKVTVTVVVAAEWNYDGTSSSSGDYTISYDVSTSGTFDYILDFDCASSADEKEQVVFTVGLQGAAVSSVVVKYADGSQAGCTSLGGGEYTFVMPSQNVTIILTLEESAVELSGTLSIGSYTWSSTATY